MKFEWDERKRRRVIEERGVDLLRAAQIFRNPVLTVRDTRRDYGEDRFVSIGSVDERCFVVVHAERDGCIRLITAWKGGRSEHEQYRRYLAERGCPHGNA